MSSNTSTVAVKEKHIMCHIKRQQFQILGRRVQALYNPSKGLLTDAVSDQNRRCVTGKEETENSKVSEGIVYCSLVGTVSIFANIGRVLSW